MNKIRQYCYNILKILDKISYCVLCFFVLGKILNLELFGFPKNEYDAEIRTAYKYEQYIFLFLSVLMILFLLRKKLSKAIYIEVILWFSFFLFVPYILHQIPSVAKVYNNIFY